MAERGASENTGAAYERDLTDFTDWLTKQGRSLIAAESGDIRDFLSALAERGLTRSSAARKLSTLRQFYRFLHGDGYRDDDPTAVIDSPRGQRSLPKVLSEAEVDRLLMEETGLPVIVAEDPLTCVARGGGRVLEMIEEHGPEILALE